MSSTQISQDLPAHWSLALSHGTMECRELPKSRRFYTEFLGLETIQRGDVAVWVRCGGGWVVASVCTGDKAQALPINVRWCLDMATADEVDQAHAAALSLRDDYGIQEVHAVKPGALGGTSFCLQDLDGNWWEIAHRPGRLYDSVFGPPAPLLASDERRVAH